MPGYEHVLYSEWIPSQELPGGPIEQPDGSYLPTELCGCDTVLWRRDLSDSSKFHVDVSQKVTVLVATYHVLEVPSRANAVGMNDTSSHVMMLEPGEVVLYPSDSSRRSGGMAERISQRQCPRKRCPLRWNRDVSSEAPQFHATEKSTIGPDL